MMGFVYVHLLTSEGDKFSGKGITKVRNHYANLRANIQQKATPWHAQYPSQMSGIVETLVRESFVPANLVTSASSTASRQIVSA
jgi:hypothetical protein